MGTSITINTMSNDTSTLNWTSPSNARTIEFGRLLARLVEPGDVIALNGPLGAGKTQLVRGVAVGLGADERVVSSPTFVLMCEYPGDITVVHIDAYRMRALSDLESLGWPDELLAEAVTVIEWADRIAEDLPDDRLDIELGHAGPEFREITITPHGKWQDQHDTLARAITQLTPKRPCPTCKKMLTETSPAYPFCSERCRLADLGGWFDEKYKISRPIQQNDIEELD